MIEKIETFNRFIKLTIICMILHKNKSILISNAGIFINFLDRYFTIVD